MGGVARCPESLVRNKMLIMHFDLNVKFCFFFIPDLSLGFNDSYSVVKTNKGKPIHLFRKMKSQNIFLKKSKSISF